MLLLHTYQIFNLITIHTLIINNHFSILRRLIIALRLINVFDFRLLQIHLSWSFVIYAPFRFTISINNLCTIVICWMLYCSSRKIWFKWCSLRSLDIQLVHFFPCFSYLIIILMKNNIIINYYILLLVRI